jgi:hypothetical protein
MGMEAKSQAVEYRPFDSSAELLVLSLPTAPLSPGSRQRLSLHFDKLSVLSSLIELRPLSLSKGFLKGTTLFTSP